MGDSSSIDDAMLEIEALENALRCAQTPRERRDDECSDEDPEDTLSQFEKDKDARIAQIQSQLSRLYAHLEHLKKQQALRDGIPITKDSAILIADVGFGLADTSSPNAGFLPTDKCLAIICPYEPIKDSEARAPDTYVSPTKKAGRNTPHSPSREEYVPRNMCAKIELVDRYQVVHQKTGRITVQGWSFVRPGIAGESGGVYEDRQSGLYGIDQEAASNKVHDELQSLNDLIDSIENERTPQRQVPDPASINDQLSELLAMDAQISSNSPSSGPFVAPKLFSEDQEMQALKHKLMRNRERLRQVRAGGSKEPSPSQSSVFKEESINLDMKKLRQQLRQLKHSTTRGQNNSPVGTAANSGGTKSKSFNDDQSAEAEDTSSAEESESERTIKPRVFASEEERLQERERIISELNSLKEQLERIRSRRKANAANFADLTRSSSPLSRSSSNASISALLKGASADLSEVPAKAAGSALGRRQSIGESDGTSPVPDDQGAESEEYDC